jgi:hypothetical protein
MVAMGGGEEMDPSRSDLGEEGVYLFFFAYY